MTDIVNVNRQMGEQSLLTVPNSLTILKPDQTLAPPGNTRSTAGNASSERLRDALILGVTGEPSVERGAVQSPLVTPQSRGAACASNDGMRDHAAGYVTLELKLIPRELIKHHEKTEPGKPEWLKKKIESEAVFTEAVTVAEAGDNYVVLDGHHRSKVCMLSKLPYVPAWVIPYQGAGADNYIRVSRWKAEGDAGDETAETFNSRERVTVTKDTVIQVGLSDDKFLQKSTRHQINFELPQLEISLQALRALGEAEERLHQAGAGTVPQMRGGVVSKGGQTTRRALLLARTNQPLVHNFMSFWEAAKSPDRVKISFSKSDLLGKLEASCSGDETDASHDSYSTNTVSSSVSDSVQTRAESGLIGETVIVPAKNSWASGAIRV